jgi:hypothetical protein
MRVIMNEGPESVCEEKHRLSCTFKQLEEVTDHQADSKQFEGVTDHQADSK